MHTRALRCHWPRARCLVWEARAHPQPRAPSLPPESRDAIRRRRSHSKRSSDFFLLNMAFEVKHRLAETRTVQRAGVTPRLQSSVCCCCCCCWGFFVLYCFVFKKKKKKKPTTLSPSSPPSSSSSSSSSKRKDRTDLTVLDNVKHHSSALFP